MSLIPEVGRKSFKSRTLIFSIYLILTIMGICMVVPFLITLTGSTSNDFDYDRFTPVPRYLFSEKDRFIKGLVPFFNGYRNWTEQMRAYFPEMPAHWSNWSLAGRDREGVDQLAELYLKRGKTEQHKIVRMSEDYAEFLSTYPMNDMMVYASQIDVIKFVIKDYSRIYNKKHPHVPLSGKELRRAALRELNEDWGTPFDNFYNINFTSEMMYPMDFQTWFPPSGTPRYNAFLRFKEARSKKLEPASLVIPFALRAVWYRFLQSEHVALKLGYEFNIEHYNTLAGTNYRSLYETPFPVPASFNPPLQELWEEFQRDYYPLRLTVVKPAPSLENRFRDSVREALKELKIANALLGTEYTNWNDFRLTAEPPQKPEEGKLLDLWKNYVKTLPAGERIYTSSEQAYQNFMLKKYGSLEKINTAYGTSYRHPEEIFPPFAAAYLLTFQKHQYMLSIEPVWQNYSLVGDYLLFNGNAIAVTIGLIILTLIFTLTINPLAAYALSRFNLRGHDKIILFMLATMAFPTMVSAIPAYLLMRDLGMLNTLWALVLPGAANGMSIFILKGFFDSLPTELFEAATIDGASEFQIFRIVAMPLVKPILAINSLTAFMVAYNGWEWALIICQDKEMWTIAVWLYQASSWWAASPWLVSAGFILASIPTLIVFLSCQKIILKGIVIPTMK